MYTFMVAPKKKKVILGKTLQNFGGKPSKITS